MQRFAGNPPHILKQPSIERRALCRLSPHLTSHVNRFCVYPLELDRHSPAIDYKLLILCV
jgi:hypothetical protein